MSTDAPPLPLRSLKQPIQPAQVFPAAQVQEQPAWSIGGAPLLVFGVAALLTGVALAVRNSQDHAGVFDVSGLAGAGVPAGLLLIGSIALRGLATIAPGQTLVLQVFGSYSGSIRTNGLRWVNPLSHRRKLSTKIRNQETQVAKVNDADGVPIEIAAVVVWQVQDSAKAAYAVEDFVQYVGLQTETAVRHIASTYAYDAHNEEQLSLRGHAEEITQALCSEVSARTSVAGVNVIEARITRLSYPPEIAQVMLQRQQAGAVVAARKQIVEGAVGMVEMALERLAKDDIVELDEERKAAMVSNLLVVLCGDRGTQPIVNAGSLYH